MELLGNIKKVEHIYNEVKDEKERILAEKSINFIPRAKDELKDKLLSYRNKTKEKVAILEGNDKDAINNQRKIMEEQINNIRADIISLFGELNAKLESEKAEAIREIKAESKNYIGIKERRGEKTCTKAYTVSDSKWYKPWTWGSSHTEHYTYTEYYSYCIAADAVENISKYVMESSNRIEDVFNESLNSKEIKRKLLDVVTKNFDLGSEKYDVSLFRIIAEETVSKIVFPVVNIDISNERNNIIGKFTGEITSAGEKNELSNAISNALFSIYEELTKKINALINNTKDDISNISKNVQNDLLDNINREFEELCQQCDDKDKEIAKYKEYIKILDENINSII